MNELAHVADILRTCPNCGAEDLQPVATGDARNLLCPRCGTCWHRRLRVTERVDPVVCPGCRSRRVCLASRAERSP